MHAPPFPLLLDLERVANQLRDKPPYKPILGMIRRYGDVMSALNDLRECGEALEALSKSFPDGVENSELSDHDRVVCGALMAHAIILYARATKTKSNHRGFVSVHRAMSKNLRKAHQKLVGLRDNAIAHYGPGVGGNRPAWARETVALRIAEDDTATLTLLYSRVTLQSDLISDLRSLLSYVVPLLWNMASERADVLLGECQRLHSSDEAFAAWLRAERIDPMVYFGGDAVAAKQAIESPSSAERFAKPSTFRNEFDLE
jgi:hypothetical protein